MGISPELLIYVAVFAAVLFLVEGVYLLVFGRSISLSRRVNRRLDLLEKGTGREQVLEQLRKEMGQHLRAQRIPIYGLIADKARKASIAFSPGQLVMVMAGLAVIVFVALSIATSAGLPMRILAAVAMGVGGVHVWISRRANKRMAMIEEQLPDAVELMVRSLRVGHPFSSSLNIVAREVADPLATEIGVIADEATYGRDLSDALKAMADRLDMQDLRFLAVAVTIQQQSGGNLAEILDGLAKVIRARFRLFRRVKAITAEAKWSGMFLSGFPIVALVAINLVQPGYYDEVSQTAMFIPGCLVVAAFLIVNVFVMRSLVNIKV